MMAKTERPSRKQARVAQFEARTERDPLGVVQPDTDAEFTAGGHIPRGRETSQEYVKRIRPGGQRSKARKTR
jgi:hypothetical protein